MAVDHYGVVLAFKLRNLSLLELSLNIELFPISVGAVISVELTYEELFVGVLAAVKFIEPVMNRGFVDGTNLCDLCKRCRLGDDNC